MCADVDCVSAEDDLEDGFDLLFRVHGSIISCWIETLHLVMVMRGLRSVANWRTFLTGCVVGYVVAWGIHRAVMFRTVDDVWVEETVPVLTPSWSRP